MKWGWGTPSANPGHLQSSQGVQSGSTKEPQPTLPLRLFLFERTSKFTSCYFYTPLHLAAPDLHFPPKCYKPTPWISLYHPLPLRVQTEGWIQIYVWGCKPISSDHQHHQRYLWPIPPDLWTEGKEQAGPWDKAEARRAWVQPPAACSAPVPSGPLHSHPRGETLHQPTSR